jgi:hypothetical protein
VVHPSFWWAYLHARGTLCNKPFASFSATQKYVFLRYNSGMPGLAEHDFDSDRDARCVHCGALAAGPCARCARPVCGNCSVLTEGGMRTYAICIACDRTVGRSLVNSWLTVIYWVALPLVALALLVAMLALVVPH